jgi:hypothetical protein
MKNNGKLIVNLRKTIGENRWIAISGFASVAAVTAASVLPDAFAIAKGGNQA